MIYKSYLIEQDISALKNNFTLFYGENLGLKNDFIKIIKKKNLDIKFQKYTQEEIFLNTELFFSEIYNISLFDEKKNYLIDNVTDKILDIVKELETKTHDHKFFLFSQILDKKSKIRSYFEKSNKLAIIPCYADNEINIRKLILNQLKGFQGLSPENVNMIINYTNLDRVKLNNELSKIVSYFKNKTIDNVNLEKLLDLKVNNNFDLLKDEAMNGNKIKTNTLLSDTVIDNDKIVYYINVINQRLNKLDEVYKLSNGNNLENTINSMRPPIFWKDKINFVNQAKKWDQEKVQFILNKTYDLEIKIKSGSYSNPNLLIKKLLIDICETATS
tara:strand:+ start:1322 stop:2311 length:990 start_codon:yes stop_codon:yes gene_type:complete